MEKSVVDDSDLLNRLHQYGESWMDEEGYGKLKKKTKPRKAAQSKETRGSLSDTKHVNVISRRQKKKSKQKQKKVECELEDSEAVGIPIKSQGQKQKRKLQLEKMKSELGLTSALKVNVADLNGQTDERTQINGKSSVQVVVFTDPAKKRRKTEKTSRVLPHAEPEAEIKSDDPEKPEMNLRDARFDVKMFGIKGFQSKDKESAVQDLLVQLGAKPPKRAFHNYKEYTVMRKQEIEAGKDRREMGRQFGFKFSKGDKKRRRPRDSVGHVDGQIGSYRSGVQVLKRDDIKRVKKFKVKK